MIGYSSSAIFLDFLILSGGLCISSKIKEVFGHEYEFQRSETCELFFRGEMFHGFHGLDAVLTLCFEVILPVPESQLIPACGMYLPWPHQISYFPLISQTEF